MTGDFGRTRVEDLSLQHFGKQSRRSYLKILFDWFPGFGFFFEIAKSATLDYTTLFYM